MVTTHGGSGAEMTMACSRRVMGKLF